MASGSNNVNDGSLVLYGVHPTGKEIGVGAYGRVFEVKYEGTLCAAKEVHPLLLQYARGEALLKIKEDFLRECEIWSILRHPCVVQFLGMMCVWFTYDHVNRAPIMACFQLSLADNSYERGRCTCYAQSMDLCNPWIVLRKVSINTLRNKIRSVHCAKYGSSEQGFEVTAYTRTLRSCICSYIALYLIFKPNSHAFTGSQPTL